MTTISDKYAEAGRLITQAKALLESGGDLTETQKEQINRWLSQADEIEKQAKQLEQVISRHTALVTDQNRASVEANQANQQAATEKAGFKHFYEFALAVHQAARGVRYDPRLEALETRAMSGEVGSQGAFTIPTNFQPEMLQARGENSLVRSRARVVPMGSRTVQFPSVKHTGNAAGSSAFFGGVQVYWTEENTDISEGAPSFDFVELHARELAGYAEVPNSLIRDSAVSLEAYLSGPGSFGGALGWQEDYEFLRGLGNGKPLGILNAPAKLTVTRQTASDFTFTDAVTMKSRMLMMGKPVWVMSQSVMPKYYAMKGGNNENIIIPNAAQGAPDMLLGAQILWTEKLPALGTQGDVMLVDFAAYLLGDRQQTTMDVSREAKFRANQTAFRVLESVDGQPWLKTAITLADGSTQVSPFVVLN